MRLSKKGPDPIALAASVVAIIISSIIICTIRVIDSNLLSLVDLLISLLVQMQIHLLSL